ncbi:hypothetical protein CVD28_01595 [Bacillus sp. M6-12]|uniref:DUF2196 domain-containing protein n=1 Tax=Bacillus sp. M6-12 TaxID=2054166 RepID=UPI000C7910B8|nr:DUF2196 domain-containing protein [Bacillus sp. M6-12]PLS19127.1 hypothetical protein CVD28_01595 [Bacillus sp. M6-12]
MDIDVTIKKNFMKGMMVDIIADEDAKTGKITRGYIATILSKENNKKGIKVELTSGVSGKVQYVPSKDDVKLENFKFYNKFFFLPKIYSIWNQVERKYMVLQHTSPSGKIEKTAFLFDSEQQAKDFVSGTKFESKDYSIREINRKKPIVDNFKTLEINYFRINKERKISFERMIEWENYFKNMR